MNAGRNKRKYAGTATTPAKTRVVAIAPKPRYGLSERRGIKGAFFSTQKNYPMPVSTTRTLKYAAFPSINPGIGAMGQYVFSANGCYDPDITGTGHQPYGFDQMMAMYNHYEVVESCIRVTPFSTQVTVPFVFCIKLDDNSVGTGTPELAMEMPMTASVAVSNYANGTSRTQLYKKFNQLSFWGTKSSDRETWGDVASNPVDQAYFVISAGPVSGSEDLLALLFCVEIEFVVKFHEPKDLPVS